MVTGSNQTEDANLNPDRLSDWVKQAPAEFVCVISGAINNRHVYRDESMGADEPAVPASSKREVCQSSRWMGRDLRESQ